MGSGSGAGTGTGMGMGMSILPGGGPFPATHAAPPLMSYVGDGPILASPNRFASSDGDLTNFLQDFGDRITSTAWWTAVTDGYCAPPGSGLCIGKGVGGGHVVLDESARHLYRDTVDASQSSDVRDFLQQHVDQGDFPDPTPDTAYLVYLPQGSRVSVDGSSSCTAQSTGFRGYHFWASVRPRSGGDAMRVAYAVFPDCGDGKDITASVSGALASMATNPQPNDHPAYYMQDAAWLDVRDSDGQAAGLCDGTVTEAGFTLSRAWSNKAAAAGHDPCAPAASGDSVFFSAAPAKQEIAIAAGESASVDVVAFSDAPHDDWQLEALDTASMRGDEPVLDLSLSASSVSNGTKVTLTIKVLRDPGGTGLVTYLLRSTGGNVFHGWPASVRVH
jgi:hypothetical protein